MLRPVLERLQELDRRLLRTMRTRYHAPRIEDAMKALGMAGEWGAVWVAIGVAAPPSTRPAASAGCAPPRSLPPRSGSTIWSSSPCAGAARACAASRPLAAAPSELSFPSAHATSSLAAAAAMGRVAPGSRPPLYGLAAAICLSRPYLGMHYPSDVLGGAAIGLAIGRLWPGLRGKGAEDRLIDLVASAAPSTASLRQTDAHKRPPPSHWAGAPSPKAIKGRS